MISALILAAALAQAPTPEPVVWAKDVHTASQKQDVAQKATQKADVSQKGQRVRSERRRVRLFGRRCTSGQCGR